jgi:hypothetical protein
MRLYLLKNYHLYSKNYSAPKMLNNTNGVKFISMYLNRFLGVIFPASRKFGGDNALQEGIVVL